MSETLYWYDLETFGLDPQFDKIAQFAGVRTNSNFEIIEPPVVLYCKITPDYIPDPKTCLITKITPQKTLKDGVCEYDFIKKINECFSVPGTTVVGYNNIRFDDEFIRNALYRNLLDPYEREWKNGNKRWDLIDLLRMTHDLRPEGINWCYNSDGFPVFKLEELTKANNIVHDNAHDALNDVYATISLAKLIYEKQPKIFKYYFKSRDKVWVKNFFKIDEKIPFVHTSAMLLRKGGATSIMTPLIFDPKKRNQVICYDLRFDPTEMLSSSAEEIRENIYTKKEVVEASGKQRFPLKGISFNKCPAIAPLSVLTEEQEKILNINMEECLKHNEMIKKDLQLIQKLWKVFNPDSGDNISHSDNDPDFQIYNGFFSDSDKEKLEIIHKINPEDILNVHIDFEDKKLETMVFRFACRNYYRLLDDDNKKKWKNFCANRLMNSGKRKIDLHFYKRKIKEQLESMETEAKDKIILKQLLLYADKVEREVFEDN